MVITKKIQFINIRTLRPCTLSGFTLNDDEPWDNLILSHTSNSPFHQTLHGFLLDLEDLDPPRLHLPPAVQDTHATGELADNINKTDNEWWYHATDLEAFHSLRPDEARWSNTSLLETDIVMQFYREEHVIVKQTDIIMFLSLFANISVKDTEVEWGVIHYAVHCAREVC